MRNDLKNFGVLLSVTNDKKYLDWVPYTTASYKALGINPIIISIDFELPPSSNYINIPFLRGDILKDIPAGSISQVIRLYYPALLKNYDSIIIGDIDQFILPHSYFTDNLYNSVMYNKFINMRHVIFQDNYYMGWNCAPPNIWGDVFNVFSENDLYNNIYNLYIDNKIIHGTSQAWALDQCTLKKKLINYNNKILISGLDLYSIGITEKNNIKAGIFENKKNKHEIIYDIKQFDLNKFIVCGTSGGSYFNKDIIIHIMKIYDIYKYLIL